MTSTTPTLPPPRSRSPSRRPSRPTTPLRPSSRTSLRRSLQSSTSHPSSTPLEPLEPLFAELSDSLADLDANFAHLRVMHESLRRFEEGFASFLYGLEMNAFCVDFVEAPGAESFARASRRNAAAGGGAGEAEATFLTSDTSFVENPPGSSKMASRLSMPAEPKTPKAARGGMRGAATSGAGRGGNVGSTRGGIRGRGVPRASGIARGVGRGRGISR